MAGVTWKPVKLPKKKRVGVSLEFLGAKTGFLIDSREHLWKTVNGGKKWLELFGGASSDMTALAMTSGHEGFVGVTRFGNSAFVAYVLRTSDGGRTWRPQAIARAPQGRAFPLEAILATAAQQGYGLVGDDHLFFTSTQQLICEFLDPTTPDPDSGISPFTGTSACPQ